MCQLSAERFKPTSVYSRDHTYDPYAPVILVLDLFIHLMINNSVSRQCLFYFRKMKFSADAVVIMIYE